MFLRFRAIVPLFLTLLICSPALFAQDPAEKKDEKKDEKQAPAVISSKDAAKNPTAEQIAESVIFIYSRGGGRSTLNQIRKTAIERGKMTVANSDGRMEQANYQKWTTRGDTLTKEKIRFEQEFPSVRYSLVYNDDKIFGVFNDSVFTPREDASRAFQNQIVYGLEALLRYKENASKLELGKAGTEKVLGVEFYIIDVTDKESRKTRFYVSAKRFHVMMLEYEDAGIKYRRKFYDYNYAQGTLVPFQTILWANDKVVEETEVGTVTFGQKIDDAMFAAS